MTKNIILLPLALVVLFGAFLVISNLPTYVTSTEKTIFMILPLFLAVFFFYKGLGG